MSGFSPKWFTVRGPVLSILKSKWGRHYLSSDFDTIPDTVVKHNLSWVIKSSFLFMQTYLIPRSIEFSTLSQDPGWKNTIICSNIYDKLVWKLDIWLKSILTCVVLTLSPGILNSEWPSIRFKMKELTRTWTSLPLFCYELWYSGLQLQPLKLGGLHWCVQLSFLPGMLRWWDAAVAVHGCWSVVIFIPCYIASYGSQFSGYFLIACECKYYLLWCQ